MKKIHILCAAAAALVMTTSCEEILNVITTNPTFSVTDTVYDGQTQQLQKLGTCKYAWSTDSPTMVTFEDKEEGSKVITYATFKFPGTSAKCQKVSITAKNAEDDSIDPVTNSTTVRIWAFYFYKKNGDNWEKLDGYNNATVSANGTYRAQMVALQDDNSWKEVSVINYKFSLSGGTENGKLDWTINPTTGVTIDTKGETYIDFTVSTKRTYNFTAKLGDVSRYGTFIYQ